jgi:hypothetical protein
MTEVRAADGVLSCSGPAGTLALELGPEAANWAEKILHPRDQDFLAELEEGTAFLSIGRAVRNCDAVFFGVTSAAELRRLAALKKSLTRKSGPMDLRTIRVSLLLPR